MKRTIKGKNYEWRELEGLLAILKWSGERGQPLAEVTVTEPGETAQFNPYGTMVRYVQEGMLYASGEVLACATVSEWGGTFQTHDDVRVRYYALTPVRRR